MLATEQKKEFGAAIKSERTRLGLSQESLAERADLHRTYITDIERGARNLSLETIYKLAGALGVSIETLFTRKEIRQQFEQFSNAAAQLVDVLLVEDDPRDVELTLAAFSGASLANRVLVVRDGAAALDFVFCRRQYAHRRIEQSPRVILLDLNLPKIHGLEVLRRIKADDRTRNFQVVVLTVSREDDHIRQAIDLGASAYIVKPVDFHNFSKITPKLSLHWALLGTALPGSA
jgi:CheY-like chemotaxis protein/DNA-binding XRE family transcriptional regulator